MKKMMEIFHNPKKGKAQKWPHYFEIYEKHFNKFRDKEIKILEIGVCEGGSLWMWKEYFPKSKVFGIDIDPNTKKFEGENVEVFIGSQTDTTFLHNFAEQNARSSIPNKGKTDLQARCIPTAS